MLMLLLKINSQSDVNQEQHLLTFVNVIQQMVMSSTLKSQVNASLFVLLLDKILKELTKTNVGS